MNLFKFTFFDLLAPTFPRGWILVAFTLKYSVCIYICTQTSIYSSFSSGHAVTFSQDQVFPHLGKALPQKAAGMDLHHKA